MCVDKKHFYILKEKNRLNKYKFHALKTPSAWNNNLVRVRFRTADEPSASPNPFQNREPIAEA